MNNNKQNIVAETVANTAEPINFWLAFLDFFAIVLCFIFNPNKWRLCLLEYLESDSVGEQNKKLVDLGIVMTTSNRNFGVEIEFVHSYDHADKIYTDIKEKFPNWFAKGDSSIRPYGTEINSPILSGEDGLKEVERMMDYLRSNKAIRVNNSCGLHVHVSAEDLTPVQVIATSYRYANAEEQFFDRIMNKSRNENNRYCMTAKRNKLDEGIQKRLYDLKQTLSSFEYFRRNNSFDKYRKLHICCHGHGTVEFRHHHATLNKFEVLNWISFVTSFVDATKKNIPQDALDESHFNVEIPQTENSEQYKIILDLRKFVQEYPTRNMSFADGLFSLVKRNRELVLYELDFNSVMTNEANMEFIKKMEERGFTLSHQEFKEEWNNQKYFRTSLNYKNTPVRKILNQNEMFERDLAVIALNKIEKTISTLANNIDLFDVVPNKTILYYINLFNKKTKKLEKLKKVAINVLRDRPQEV